MTKRSMRSSPQNLPIGQRRSTTSWTIPEPGDVLCYSYLWAWEAAKGQEEGVKDRPTVVVVARRELNGVVHIWVAPVTHSAPADGQKAVEIPVKVKRHLGMDDERSWIVTTEMNRFIWPGPDIRPVPGGDGSPFYGEIPSRLFDEVRQKMAPGHFHVTKRTS